MLNKEDIEHLATLARVAIYEEEKESFATQLDSVLSYVSDISKVATADSSSAAERMAPIARAGELRNVMRPDEHTPEGGRYTKDILANAPDSGQQTDQNHDETRKSEGVAAETSPSGI